MRRVDLKEADGDSETCFIAAATSNFAAQGSEVVEVHIKAILELGSRLAIGVDGDVV
eukprot:CAMPEP_0180081364 /NCGR_PEP_ID=MMETSP0985-20121206/18097_1 /TAXON_ID=483367 /ORGANISM="non described non described, Strain CCMP 2436" /LENGTH=56 /DNA_ID=CAMNT_0022014571 /DNA_START=66 /DNA_END=232 /DNA_ORIENTATION=+